MGSNRDNRCARFTAEESEMQKACLGVVLVGLVVLPATAQERDFSKVEIKATPVADNA